MHRARLLQVIALATCVQLAKSTHPIARKKYKLTPIYHISAPYGFMHGPSSFVRYKGIYHIFYEMSYPQHSSGRHWGHAISSNLVEWTHVSAALHPKEFYEKSCLSGSAFPHGNRLNLFYTGQVVVNNDTYETQNLAYSKDGFNFRKFIYNPIVSIFPKGIGNFRHPKVWRKNNKWYMLIGSSNKKRKGCLYMCSSPNIHEWRDVRMIATSTDTGSAWENPDLFKLNGRDVLILTVKDYKVIGDYKTSKTIAIVPDQGLQWWKNLNITRTLSEFLDYGHDFNVVKTARATDGRRLLIGWLGTTEANTSKLSSGMLTTIRELTLGPKNEVLIVPVKEMLGLREELMFETLLKPNEIFFAATKSFELVVNATKSEEDAVLDFLWNNMTQYTLSYAAAAEVMSVERLGENGIRAVHWYPENIKWRIFVDHCSIEVFCGDGELVFSSLIHPLGFIQVRVGGEAPLQVAQYRLRASIKYSKSFYPK